MIHNYLESQDREISSINAIAILDSDWLSQEKGVWRYLICKIMERLAHVVPAYSPIK